MKAAFFHDNLFKKYKGDYYTDTDLSFDFLKNYLEYFDNLKIVAREEEIDDLDLKKFGKSSAENISFDCTKAIGIKTYFSGYLNRLVKKNVSESDFSIIRLPSIMGIIACAACRKQKKPYLVEVVADAFYVHWYHGNKFFKILSFPIEFLVRREIKKAPHVMYVSKYLKTKYKTEGDNVVVSDVRIKKAEKSVFAKAVSRIDQYTDKTTYKIGLIGSLDVVYKGHKEAIKATRLVREAGINIEMHFLGQLSDTSREKWTQLAEKEGVRDYIFFDGTRPSGEGVKTWLEDMDVFILPSYTEGLGRSIIEAMNVGLPCLGSDTGGVPELIEKAALFTPKSEKSLAEALIKVLKNKDELKELVAWSEARVEDFDREKLTKAREAYYKKIGLEKKNA